MSGLVFVYIIEEVAHALDTTISHIGMLLTATSIVQFLI